jgi:hypothetical protein
LNEAGVHPLVRWQESQAAVVGTWLVDLPRAALPLWQVAQDPAATPAWLNAAPVHAEVRWQESHDAVVTTCPGGLPPAVAPLWQDAQVPGTTPKWTKRAPVNVTVLWQTSQGCCVGACEGGMVIDATRVPAPWQPTQVRGVPLNTPRTWQVSQRVSSCAPVRANPVARCWDADRGVVGLAWALARFGASAPARIVTMTTTLASASAATRIH